MLIAIDNLIGQPIMSLQTGTELATTTGVIVDPRQLTIAAFYVEGQGLEQSPSVLHPVDIRELGELGIIVDDTSKLMSLDGLVRLQEVIDFDFELLGLKVVDEQKRRLGKVSGYGVETDSYTIIQIYTEQSLLRSISTMSGTIHREQIVSVNKNEMVVQAPTIRGEVAKVAGDARRVIANPFRGGSAPND